MHLISSLKSDLQLFDVHSMPDLCIEHQPQPVPVVGPTSEARLKHMLDRGLAKQ